MQQQNASTQAFDSFEITYRPAEADYFGLMHRYIRLTRGRLMLQRALQVFVVGTGAMFAYLAWQTRDPVLACFALILLSGPVTAPAINHWVWRRAFDRQRLGASDVTLRFDDDGIASSSERGQSQIPWSTVERLDVSPTHAFLWISGMVGLMAPKRAFPDAAAFDRFVDFARARVQAKAQG